MSAEKTFQADIIAHEVGRGNGAAVQRRSLVCTGDPVDIPSFKLSTEGRTTVAKLYGSLRDSEQVIAVIGWDQKDRSAELALQLGLGLASLTEESVLLVDVADRKPYLHELLKTGGTPGVNDILNDTSTAPAAIRPTSVPGLSFLSCGISSDPRTSAFSLPAWNEAMAPLRQYRRVILHLGSLAVNARGTVIASQSDAVVLAVAAGIRRRHEVMELWKSLESLHVRLAGAVLTTKE